MQFQTMDVIAFRPRNWVGRVIAWFTNSPFSHVGVVTDPDTQVIVEATLTVKSSSLLKGNRAFSVFRPKKGLDPAQVLEGKWYLASMLGAGYDFPNVVDWFINVFRRALNRSYRSYWGRDDRPICSELVARAYLAMGEDPTPGIPPEFVTPQDLVRSSYFIEVSK